MKNGSAEREREREREREKEKEGNQETKSEGANDREGDGDSRELNSKDKNSFQRTSKINSSLCPSPPSLEVPTNNPNSILEDS